VVRVLILILGVVAGLGHVALGKRMKGLILFALFVTFANLAFVGRVILEGPYKKELFIVGAIGACLIWFISYATLILNLFRRRGNQDA
jgi:arginine exporter protein ArgO